MIDRAHLENVRQGLLEQREQALGVFNQAVGALLLVDDLIARIDQPAPNGKGAMTMKDLSESIARGAKAPG